MDRKEDVFIQKGINFKSPSLYKLLLTSFNLETKGQKGHSIWLRAKWTPVSESNTLTPISGAKYDSNQHGSLALI